jgi:hypothetical protein
LHVYGATNNSVIFEAGTGYAEFGLKSTGGGRSWYQGTGWSGAGNSANYYIQEVNGSDNPLRVVINTNGNVGIGTTSPTISDGVGLHLAGKILRIGTSKTPASAGAAGNAGEICWDADYLYVCIATNMWRRIAHATW